MALKDILPSKKFTVIIGTIAAIVVIVLVVSQHFSANLTFGPSAKNAPVEARGTLDDVVSVVVYTTDMREFRNIVAARTEFFIDRLPTSTIVEVAHLADPGLLIEIQAIAAL